MPGKDKATLITRELLPKSAKAPQIEKLIKLRLKAGCIRCWIEDKDGQKFLLTEWNIIGQQ